MSISSQKIAEARAAQPTRAEMWCAIADLDPWDPRRAVMMGAALSDPPAAARKPPKRPLAPVAAHARPRADWPAPTPPPAPESPFIYDDDPDPKEWKELPPLARAKLKKENPERYERMRAAGTPKTWTEMRPMERAMLHRADAALYDRMRAGGPGADQLRWAVPTQ